jgi:hypothetical protein
MFASLQRTSPSHLLDPHLFDFANLKTQPDAYENGDIAFDDEDFSARLIQFPTVKSAN